jgi:hypothetical protein
MLKVHPRYWLRGVFGSPAFVAWTLFLALNVIINLPFFLFNREDWHLIPLPGIDLHSWQELIFTREHIDLLRLNAELSLAMAVWALFWAKWNRKGRVWFWRSFLFFFLYLLWFIKRMRLHSLDCTRCSRISTAIIVSY